MREIKDHIGVKQPIISISNQNIKIDISNKRMFMKVVGFGSDGFI